MSDEEIDKTGAEEIELSSSQWFNAAQLLLSEKRTALSILRTGAAIFALPLSVLGLLIATFKLYQDSPIQHLIIPLLIICGALVILAIYLIARALMNISHYDKLLHELKKDHEILKDLMD